MVGSCAGGKKKKQLGGRRWMIWRVMVCDSIEWLFAFREVSFDVLWLWMSLVFVDVCGGEVHVVWEEGTCVFGGGR